MRSCYASVEDWAGPEVPVITVYGIRREERLGFQKTLNTIAIACLQPGGGGGGGTLPIVVYTERLRPKVVPFSRFRHMKG